MKIRNVILCGDVIEKLKELPDKSVQCVITSPPYYNLRQYGTGKWIDGDPNCEHETIPARGGRGGSGPESRNSPYPSQYPAKTCSKCGAIFEDKQIGLEEYPELYVQKMVEVFREVWRVLRDDGIVFLNLGDSYASNGIYIGKYKETHPEHEDLHVKHSTKYPQARKGTRGGEYHIKPKDMVGIPWRVAFALQADGWYLRRDIIWAKGVSFCPTYSGNCMPESTRDRPTSSHEYIFILTKSARYFYDQEAVKEKATIPEDWVHIPESKQYNTGKNMDGGAAKTENPQTSEGLHRQKGGVYSPTGRNLRSVWTINPKPYPEAHFATFSLSLVEPMIKLGSSEYGACPKCGAPWVRIIQKGESDEEWKHACGADSQGEYRGQSDKWLKQDALGKQTYTGFNKRWKEKQQNASDVKRNVLNGLREVTYTWKPSCDCGCEERIPCIVMDIFGGAGTVGEAARSLGRDWILIELNPEYVKLTEKRLRLNEGLDRFMG